MFSSFFENLSNINLQVFLISMLLFFVGYAMAPFVYHRQYRWLIAYPLWVAKKLEKWSKKKWNPWLIFLFIFSVNLFSLYLNFFQSLL